MKKKELKYKVEILEKELKEKDKEIADLKKQLNLKEKNNLDKIMKNYAYGILVDRNTYPGITFYNEGRKEVFIKELDFNVGLGIYQN